MKIFIIVLFVTTGISGIKDIGELNVVKFDMEDLSYTKLMRTEKGFLSAPPMVFLDTLKLKKYKCFKNIRSSRWSLAIPVIFWNQTYMDTITKSIDQIEFFKTFEPNVPKTILPPSGILAYRMNWRRRYELFDDNSIHLDSFWYNGAANYVLPRYQNFVMEFVTANDTENYCEEIKEQLLNETFQIQEFCVDFVVKKATKDNLPPVKVSIGDVRSTKMFEDSKCDKMAKCLVSYKYAEKWAYEVSAGVIKGLNVVHLTLQKEVYDAVLNYFFCKDKVSIAEIESQVIKKLFQNNKNDMGCRIPENVFKRTKNVCNSQYDHTYRSYKEKCADVDYNFDNEVAVQVDPILIYDERNEFSITIKR